MTEHGVLRVDDPELAARQFLDLCKTGIHLRLLLGDREPPTQEEIERNLNSAVKVFLAAYGPLAGKGRTHVTPERLDAEELQHRPLFPWGEGQGEGNPFPVPLPHGRGNARSHPLSAP